MKNSNAGRLEKLEKKTKTNKQTHRIIIYNPNDPPNFDNLRHYPREMIIAIPDNGMNQQI